MLTVSPGCDPGPGFLIHDAREDVSAMSARLIAVKILEQVFSGASLGNACQQHLPDLADTRDRGLAQELAYGVCRWHFRLMGLVDALTQRPLRKRDQDLKLLLAVGLYQLLYTRIPQHAALSATVQVTVLLDKVWAKGLVNGVLRNFLRRQESLLPALDRDPVTRWSYPRWLLQAWRTDWPEDWEAIAGGGNEYPPMVLRVNRVRTTVEQYLALLQQQGIAAAPVLLADDAVTLEQALPVTEIPGFSDGLVSVQDAAAQLAVDLLDLAPGMRVLDACAAPGGKSCHILERQPTSLLLSVDIEQERAAQIMESYQRLGLQGQVLTADAASPDDWWDGVPFDRILLDAPCTGTGVIRRHPDIKILRKQEDVPQLADKQTRLLRNLWPLLKNHGKLVYATCSALKTENAERLQEFIRYQPDAKVDDPGVSWGMAQPIGRQILPGSSIMDGFYYGRLSKSTA